MVMTADYGRTHMGQHIVNSYRPATFDCMENRGNRIRSMRKALDLTQPELAKAVGVDQSTVSDWEKHNAEPKGEALIALAKLFNTTAEYIMEGQDANAWPFENIPYASFLSLEHDERTRLEGRLQEILASISAPQNKFQTNRQRAASVKTARKRKPSR